jgi:hypothetical protein
MRPQHSGLRPAPCPPCLLLALGTCAPQLLGPATAVQRPALQEVERWLVWHGTTPAPGAYGVESYPDAYVVAEQRSSPTERSSSGERAAGRLTPGGGPGTATFQIELRLPFPMLRRRSDFVFWHRSTLVPSHLHY